MNDPIFAINPLDGRYSEKLKNLSAYFSEFALMKYRLFIEIEWFIFLCNEAKLQGTRVLNQKELKILQSIEKDFELMDAKRIKEIEKTTNHDVKAVEYFIKEHLKPYPRLSALSEFIHFGCTSEDINNLAYALMIKDFKAKEFMPVLTGVTEALHQMALKYKNDAMLSRTHGQPASPTTMGKELINFSARLSNLIDLLEKIPNYAKFHGAVGSFNAHFAAYPNVDWLNLNKKFVQQIGSGRLTWNAYVTQIEPHDMMAVLFNVVAQINTVLIDLSRDIWLYISMGYFKQKPKQGEIGSSTMPHKINPIDFENAEGNLGMANAIFRHFAEKLPISRLQRDLSDSTVMRNIGIAFGYSILAYKNLLSGFQKLEINREILKKDLNENWEVLAEAVQTVLRKYKISGAYEKLKKLTRGKKLTEKELRQFISQLKIPEIEKKRLLKLTPASYTGLASKLTDYYRPKLFS